MIQTADRFPLRLNLCTTAENGVDAHRRFLILPPQNEAERGVTKRPSTAGDRGQAGGKHARPLRRGARDVWQGCRLQVIAKTLHMDRKAVHKYASTAMVEELICPPRQSRRMLQPWASLRNLHRQESCTDSERRLLETNDAAIAAPAGSVRRGWSPCAPRDARSPK
ncbi:hypothetical protein [Streptomyces kronopolitis]|uniref:hypothetical protein n=1 Tax=Streptomyces kronopolitis TaxID=1612435 RepID=UPI00368C7585